jgi:hypothetical protein
MGRDGDGDGAVEEQGYFIIAFMGWLVFLGNTVRFISPRFLRFVLCLSSPPLC